MNTEDIKTSGKISLAIMTRNEEATIEQAVRGVLPYANETLIADGRA